MPQPAAERNLSSLAKLFPGRSEEEYTRLEAWYSGYAALILRMYERITSDPEAYARFLALTDRAAGPTMTGKVDSPKETKDNQ